MILTVVLLCVPSLRKTYKLLRYNEFNKIAIFLKIYLLLYIFLNKNKALRIIFSQKTKRKQRFLAA